MTSFVTTLDDKWKDPNNFKTAKAFVSFIAPGIPGRERGSKPGQSPVIQSWKNPAAGWKWDRRGSFDLEVKTSMRNVSLYQFLVFESVLLTPL